MALPSVAGRAVHVKFHPRPHSLSESTDILKILERYGQVEYFRQLQFEPVPARNSAVAIYRHREGATKACRASPLRFRYGESENAQEYGLHAMDTESRQQAPEPTSGLGSDGDASTQGAGNQPSQQHVPTSGPSTFSYTSQRTPQTPPSTAPQTERPHDQGREVHLQISESTLNHDLYLKRQYYHGSWRPKIRTIMARDLDKRTPMPNMGNMELRRGEVLPRLRKKRDENPRPPLPRLGLLWQESKARAERAKGVHG